MPDPSYNTKVYTKQGGAEFVVAKGGKLTVEDGGNVTGIGDSVRKVAGTTDEIQASDHGNTVQYTSADPVCVTVPAGLTAGFTCRLLQIGAGQFSVAGDDGVTLINARGAFDSNGPGALCWLIADADDHLVLGGDVRGRIYYSPVLIG